MQGAQAYLLLLLSVDSTSRAGGDTHTSIWRWPRAYGEPLAQQAPPPPAPPCGRTDKEQQQNLLVACAELSGAQPQPFSSSGKHDHSSPLGPGEVEGEVPECQGPCVLLGRGQFVSQRAPHDHKSGIFIYLGPFAF